MHLPSQILEQLAEPSLDLSSGQETGRAFEQQRLRTKGFPLDAGPLAPGRPSPLVDVMKEVGVEKP